MRLAYAIPTANPALCSETFAKWKARGYTTAALIDAGEAPGNADIVLRVPAYEGYGASVNLLCQHLDDCDWVVTGGDDVYPADQPGEEIAAECTEHFGGTFGVMQPAGGADHCCVSPWIGKEFRQRAYQGNGPYWPEYRHYFDDQELAEVATRLGCLWRRADLTQFHNHWSLRSRTRPAYLEKAAAGWNRASELFNSRKAAGFPGHEPSVCDAATLGVHIR